MDIQETIEIIRQIFRAKMGLSKEDDPFLGLINVSDPREKARLTEHDYYGHSLMRLGAKTYPDALEVWGNIAEMEDVYSPSIDGEQRKEAILLRRTQPDQPSPLTIQLPTIDTKPPEEKKPHWWSRGKPKT